MSALIKTYESSDNQGIESILDFHVRMERIIPFDDANGRVGRLLMFKECLRHDVMPFIIDDKRRKQYLDGLRHWGDDNEVLQDVVGQAQKRFADQIDFQKREAARICAGRKGVDKDEW